MIVPKNPDRPPKKWTNQIRKLGRKQLKLLPHETVIIIEACVYYARNKDRYEYICERIERFRSSISEDNFNHGFLSKGFLQAARLMRKEMLEEALVVHEDRMAEQAKLALEGEADMLPVLLEQQRVGKEALAGMAFGSKEYVNALTALEKLNSMIEKYSSLGKTRRRQEKVEDAALGINTFTKKKTIELELMGKGDNINSLPSANGQNPSDHNIIDQDLEVN